MREVTTKFLAFFNPNRKLVNPCSRASIIGTSFGTTAGGVWNQLLRRATYEQDTSLASIRREGLRPNRLNRCLFSSASLSKPVDGCAHWQLDTIGTSMNPWLTSSFVHVTTGNGYQSFLDTDGAAWNTIAFAGNERLHIYVTSMWCIWSRCGCHHCTAASWAATSESCQRAQRSVIGPFLAIQCHKDGVSRLFALSALLFHMTPRI